MLTRPCSVDDRVGVEVEDALLKLLQVAVELESGVASGESGHEDVDTTVVGLILFEVGIDNFERVIIGESDLTYVIEGVRHQSKEMMRCVDCFGGGLVEILPKLSPEAVEHEFGGGLASRVLDNEVGIKVDAFFLLVLPHVLSFVCRSSGPGGVASRFLFNFEPGVDILCKESNFASFRREVVDFMDLDEGVPQFDGFLDLGGAPFSSERPLLGGVLTVMRFLQQGFGHFLFHARLAEWEREFALVSVWQDGMVQVVRR